MSETEEKNLPRPASWWSEEDGDVLWWCWRDGSWLGEAPYVGSPLDLGQEVLMRATGKTKSFFVGGWPGYHTHWTRLPDLPPEPKFPTGMIPGVTPVNAINE